MFTAMTTAMLYGLWAAVPWAAIFLLTQFIGIRLYVTRDKTICQQIQRRIAYASHTTDNGHPTGYCVGRWYIGLMEMDCWGGEPRYSLWLVATRASYERLTAERLAAPPPIDLMDSSSPSDTKEAVASAPPITISVYNRGGTYTHSYWSRRRIPVDAIAPRPAQTSIIQRIQEHQRRTRHTVALLHGPPGCGKTMVGVLLAGALGGTFCNTLCPWRPGDQLADLYAEAEPDADKPLVVVLDEVDVGLVAVHAGVPSHAQVPISVQTKTDWNRMLDEIGRGMYPHMVLLLTTNRTPEFLRELDPSYIRPGRVDIIVGMGDGDL
jgi:hypothetical protein